MCVDIAREDTILDRLARFLEAALGDAVLRTKEMEAQRISVASLYDLRLEVKTLLPNLDVYRSFVIVVMAIVTKSQACKRKG